MITVTTIDRGRVRPGTIEDLERQSCTWAHIISPTSDELAQVAAHVRMPKEEILEILSRTQRPTLRELDGFSVIVFRSPRDGGVFTTKPIVCFVSTHTNDIITIAPHPSKSVERVLTAPENRRIEIFTAGATAILFAVLDEVVNSYFRVFDAMDDELARIEHAVRSGDVSRQVMDRIYDLKKTLIYFHKALVGNREVISGIEREHAASLDRTLLAKFRVLHDQLVQLVELDATYRDILTSTLEVHLSTISNYLNVTVKKVTSWGAIILIPSLIASVFGMNFDLIPTAHAQYGFYGVIGLMIIATGALYTYFKRKDWI